MAANSLALLSGDLPSEHCRMPVSGHCLNVGTVRMACQQGAKGVAVSSTLFRVGANAGDLVSREMLTAIPPDLKT